MSQVFILLSKAASQLLFFVLAKISTQVKVYDHDHQRPAVVVIFSLPFRETVINYLPSIFTDTDKLALKLSFLVMYREKNDK